MVTREDLVEQSVTTFVREALLTRGYPADKVELVETFPAGNLEQLDHCLVALGYNLDDEGTQAELGSDLTVRVYRFEFFVFGTTRTEAKNVSNVIKFALQADYNRVPLLQVDQAGQPEIDTLIIVGASADRQVIPDPEPWQEYVWLTTAAVEDTYAAALT